jgi:outer membrane lipoprotein SlyB
MKTITRTTLAAFTITGAALLTGCVSTAPQPDYYPQQSNDSRSNDYYPSQSTRPEAASYGTIDSIQVTRVAPSTTGTGVVAGGVVGALLGNQIGSGSGRTAATVAGAVGGAMVGNQIEKSRTQAYDAYQVGVRLENGDFRTITQDNVQDLRVGTRVRVIDGHVYRY